MTDQLILQTEQTLACGEEFRGKSDESWRKVQTCVFRSIKKSSQVFSL